MIVKAACIKNKLEQICVPNKARLAPVFCCQQQTCLDKLCKKKTVGHTMIVKAACWL